MPVGNVKGNGGITVSYTANGEASDYLLGVKGLYSMSPELGTSSKISETFFIQKFSDMQTIVQQNYNWILYTVK